MSTGDDHRRAWADDQRGYWQALVDAGFSRKEAMALMLRPQVTVSSVLAPEMSEFFSKITALMDRQL